MADAFYWAGRANLVSAARGSQAFAGDISLSAGGISAGLITKSEILSEKDHPGMKTLNH